MIFFYGINLPFQPRMDQYFTQMDKIVIEKKTSSRVRFMLQDVIDLRKVSRILKSKYLKWGGGVNKKTFNIER